MNHTSNQFKWPKYQKYFKILLEKKSIFSIFQNTLILFYKSGLHLIGPSRIVQDHWHPVFCYIEGSDKRHVDVKGAITAHNYRLDSVYTTRRHACRRLRATSVRHSPRPHHWIHARHGTRRVLPEQSEHVPAYVSVLSQSCLNRACLK